MTTQPINLNKDLTNAGQFLTAPISLLFGRKVELIEKSSSLLTKIGLIALSSLLLIGTLGLSYFIGINCKQIKKINLDSPQTKAPIPSSATVLNDLRKDSSDSSKSAAISVELGSCATSVNSLVVFGATAPRRGGAAAADHPQEIKASFGLSPVPTAITSAVPIIPKASKDSERAYFGGGGAC